MAHSNYAKDRDLMMEAYASISGKEVAPAFTTRPARMLVERADGTDDGECEDCDGHGCDVCNDTGLQSDRRSEDAERITKVELGGKVYELGSPDPNDDGLVINIEKHPNGYFITGGVYSEPEDYVNDPENPREGYGYALTHDGQPMDEDDLEDGLGHEDNEDKPVGSGKKSYEFLGYGREDAEGASGVGAVVAAIDELAATLHGNDKLAALEDLSDYLKLRLSHTEDGE